MKSLRKVEVFNQSALVDFEPRRVERLARVLDEFLPENLRAPAGWLSVAVMDDEALCKIHSDFLGDPSKTDVITFEGDPLEGFAGEICVSAERALEVCGGYSNTPNLELCLYVAHGMLHLAGVDDILPEDAAKMRAAEAAAMGVIKRKFRKNVFNFKEGKNV